MKRHYLEVTPHEWLTHYPRFLKALARRLEKLKDEPLVDRKKMLQYKSLWNKYKGYSDEKKLSVEGQNFRWLLEEFRVSLYAQNLRTSIPVSEKRLKESLEKV